MTDFPGLDHIAQRRYGFFQRPVFVILVQIIEIDVVDV